MDEDDNGKFRPEIVKHKYIITYMHMSIGYETHKCHKCHIKSNRFHAGHHSPTSNNMRPLTNCLIITIITHAIMFSGHKFIKMSPLAIKIVLYFLIACALWFKARRNSPNLPCREENGKTPPFRAGRLSSPGFCLWGRYAVSSSPSAVKYDIDTSPCDGVYRH